MVSDDPDVEYKWSCNQIRSRLRKYIENGGTKTTEMQAKLGCNSNSSGRFMRYTGAMQGCDNGVYHAATEFFLDMERRGEKMPKAKVAHKENEPVAAAAAATGKKSKAAASTLDVSGVNLDGQDKDAVPIFDSCDVVRREIEAHINLPGVTRASLMRNLAAQFESQSVNFQSKQLNDFLGKRGALAGCTSRVYYAAYVFFERRRIAEGKPKTPHRLGMETEHPKGVDTTSRHDRVLCFKGEVPVEEEFGRLRFVRG